MRARQNQVSTPNPEFGVDFDASARAMHQSALKGSLMVHETAFSTPAVPGRFLGATRFERKQMLKTLKSKIALVAVAGLGFGLVSTVPAFAASAAAITSWNVAKEGTTAKADVASTNGEVAVYTRVGQTLTFKALVADDRAAGDLWQVAQIAGTNPATAPDATFCVDTALDAATATTTCSITVTNAMNGKVFRVQIKPSGGTYSVKTDLGITLTVVNAGAPASLTWAQNTREISSTSVDYTVNVTPKDSNGVSTVLIDGEKIVLDINPQTGVSTTQVEVHSNVNDDTNDFGVVSESEATAGGASTYAVQIDGANDSGAANTGSTIAGTTYTISGQLVSSGAAIGAPASATYTRVSNTAGLTGVISFWNGNTSTATAVTSLSSIANVAAVDTYAKVADSNGALIKGVTVGLAFSGLTGTIRNTGDAADITTVSTGQDGFSTAPFRPKAAAAQSGTGITTASISTGVTSISATLPLTVTAVGTTVASGLTTTVKANNGNGITAGTATATTAPVTSSISTTSFTVTITGLDASKAVVARLNNASNTTTPKIDGTAKNTPIYKVADASGAISFTITTASAGDTQHIDLDVDGDVSGVYELSSVITYATAVGALTTAPATATTTFVAVGTTNDIVATVADQFGNAVTGGYVTITNTVVPVTVTAMTAAQLNTDTSGKATMKAIIASTAGSYAFEVKAFDANGNQIGTTSTVSYTATTDGAPGSVTLTAGGSEDGVGTYTLWVSPNGTVPASANNTADAILTTDTTTAAKVAKYGNWLVITASIKNAAGTGVDNVKVGVTGTSGLYFKATAPAAGDKLSTMTATSVTTAGGGVATLYVAATKAGSHKVTLTVGSKTATASFSAATGLTTTSIARKVTLSSSTVAVTGNAITQVTATVTDEFGNPVSGVDLTGTVTGVAGRFAGGSRSFSAKTDAAGTVIFEMTGNAAESGSGTLTVTGTEDTDAAPNTDNENNKFASSDFSANLTGLSKAATSSATATLAVTAAAAAASPEITAVKADVKAVSDTVATLSKAVTTIQSSVTELTTSFTAQIKSLSAAIAKISAAIAALSKKIKK